MGGSAAVVALSFSPHPHIELASAICKASLREASKQKAALADFILYLHA